MSEVKRERLFPGLAGGGGGAGLGGGWGGGGGGVGGEGGGGGRTWWAAIGAFNCRTQEQNKQCSGFGMSYDTSIWLFLWLLIAQLMQHMFDL